MRKTIRVTKAISEMPMELKAHLADNPKLIREYMLLPRDYQREYSDWIKATQDPQEKHFRILVTCAMAEKFHQKKNKSGKSK